MCDVCEQLGFNIHADPRQNGGDGGGGGDLSAPTESFTIAEAAVHLNRIEASWVQDAEGKPILGSPTSVTYAFRNSETGARRRLQPVQRQPDHRRATGAAILV